MSEDQNKNTELVELDFSNLDRSDLLDLLDKLNEYDKRLKYNKLAGLFPSTGPYRRELYSKAVEFFAAGNEFTERVFMGGNRSGKTTTALTEDAYHATGLYPEWWEGKTFLAGDNITIWCCGKTAEKARDILQYGLLGNPFDPGTGLIPKDHIIMESIRTKSGVPGAIASVHVKRVDGGIANIVFKSYEQGLQAYQGDAVDVIHLDEEPMDPKIYSECVVRVMTRGGVIMLTFTPEHGLTPTVLRFLPYGRFPENRIVPPTRESPHISRWIVQVEWSDKHSDVPHLTEEYRKKAWSALLPHEREAKGRGIPSIGAGKIYKELEEDFSIPPFEIPYSWPRFYGMDFALSTGYTAVVWFALDRSTDTVYLYDEYKVKGKETTIHAMAINRKGQWIPGVIDPSATKKKERVTWLNHYRDLGLDIELADNSVLPGIAEISKRIQDGRFKVFFTCTNFFEEYALYRWGEDGKPAKDQNDHLLDATRYAIMSGIKRAVSLKDIDDENSENEHLEYALRDSTRNPITGY